MTEARTTRPRRSRLGLVLVLGLGTLLALEILGRVQSGLLPTTPLGFVRASWALATGSAVAEAGVPAEQVAFRPLPYVMYGLKPGFERSGEPRRTSNAHGFRGPEIELPKPAGRTRILCLGGSTTYAFAVDDEHTYPRVLERRLREQGHDVDVINAGVESYTSAESLANLLFRGLQLDPDIVVIYHAANDVRPRRYANFSEDYAHYRKVWEGGTANYRPLGGELGGINQFIQLAPPEATTDMRTLLQANTPAVFVRHLTSLAATARVHGLVPVFVSFTRNPEPTDELLGFGIDQHNRALRDVASLHDVTLIDLARSFPRDADLFVDDIHLGEEGNRLKAEAIAEGLAALLP